MKTLPFSLVLVIALVPFSAAQGTYTQIDVPGSTQTGAYGINRAGDIVGYYWDDNSVAHGFLLRGGIYTTIDYPAPNTSTYATGINDVGQVVGYNAGDLNTGFLYDIASQTFTTIDRSTSTYAFAINNSGIVVGATGKGLSTFFVGYEYVGGVLKRVLPPGFSYSGLNGINNRNEAVGSAETMSGTVAKFVFGHGRFHRIPIPMASANPVGINDDGAIVGSYKTEVGGIEGFLWQNNVFQPLVFPGSLATFGANGINGAGQVVGSFSDGLAIHGFLWTPPSTRRKVLVRNWRLR